MPVVRREKTSRNHRYNPMNASMLPTNKKHGQHLLKNPGILDKIVSACDLKPTDVAFEIGPGTGNLTMRLLEASKRVVAYEIDPRMAAEVRKRAVNAGRTQLEVHEGDVLRQQWPAFDVCATTLPYQISSPFMFKLLAHRPSFRCAVVMFQKEFAERLIANVGEAQYGRLAVNTRLFVKVSCVCKVSRGSFNPPPEVDSMVVKVVPRDPPIEVDFREWDGLMRIVFSRKRKTLRASFNTKDTLKTLEQNYKTWCALTGAEPAKESIKDMVLAALNACELAEERAIKIDLDTFFRLLLEFNRRGIHFSNMCVGAKPGEVAALPDEGFFIDDGAGDDEE
mmetsp:Transcript_39658/g.74369  ORF Transcript_39658/g.74369 Transcript_39658/m.74369 type:complete len:337 (-) Transcript_39658:150-1160(-)